ncbi:hypothetical protein UlMin_033007 [Ulmus minor]
MATVATKQPEGASQPSLKVDSLSHIDLNTLTQSELHSLSLCSSAAFDLRRIDDLIVPKIDRSIFNESAGSRRQTYSRPRLSQSSLSPASSAASTAAPGHHRRRVAGLLPSPKLPPAPADDPEVHENRAIISLFKSLIWQDPKFENIDLSPASFGNQLGVNFEQGREFVDLEGRDEMGLGVFGGERKRKRGRKPKAKVLNLEGQGYAGLDMVNKNGVPVDLSALASVEDPYGEELRRKTAGLESDEGLLEFMRELEGQWVSRRKKRRIVEASQFGDALPIGWKLLLGLKRKEGRAWIYCRRYISPTGQHFQSCKDVSSYLQSFGGLIATQQPNGQNGDIVQDYRLATETDAFLAYNDGDHRQSISSSSTQPASVSNELDKEFVLLGMENLAEVQIHDLFECRKCNMTFDEKDTYLQHLLSIHQRTTRRYRLGSSVGDGVIIKDGKFECQFCHKVFLERRRYNGHVGIHVRNYVRAVEVVPSPTQYEKVESPTRDDLPPRISKMDALIEIAQNSMLETSVGPNDRSEGGSAADKSRPISSTHVPVSSSDHELNFDSPLSEQELDDSMINIHNVDLEDNVQMVIDGTMEKIDDASGIVDVEMHSVLDSSIFFKAKKQDGTESVCLDKYGLEFSSDEVNKSGTQQEGASKCDGHIPLSTPNICDIGNQIDVNLDGNLEHSVHVEVNNNKINELNDSIDHEPANEVLTESIRQTSAGKDLYCGISDSTISSSLNAISDKGEPSCHINQRNQNLTGFEELRLEEIETYNFADGPDSVSLQDVPIDLANNEVMEGAFGSSVQIESEEVLNMSGIDQFTTSCVWCGVEFNHEAVDSGIQPADSVGFMCSSCKAKISGQPNMLDNGSPLDHHPF